MEEVHEIHPGICRMKSLARSCVWWPKIDSDLEIKVRNCEVCQTNRKLPPEAPLNPWEWPHKLWIRLHLDYAGPFPHRCRCTLEVVRSISNEHFDIQRYHREVKNCLFNPWTSRNGSYWQRQQLCKRRVRRFPETKRNPPHQNCTLSSLIKWACRKSCPNIQGGMKKLKDGSLETRVSRFLSRYRITPQTTTK